MKASFPLLILFAGFVFTLAVRPPGAVGGGLTVGGDDAGVVGPSRVVHTWGGKKPVLSRTTLRGRLVDLTGTGVAAADVVDRLGGRRTRSQADGSFELEVAAGHCLQLAVDAAGLEGNLFSVLPGADPVTLLVRPGRPWLADAEPRPTSLYGGIGSIRGGQGRMVVTVCETGQRVAADESGNFRIPIPKRSFHLIAHDDAGHVVRSEEIAAPRDDQRWMPLPLLQLVDGMRAGGYLRDHDGKPVLGGRLLVRGHGEVWRLQTDAAGAFEFAGLIEGRYTITALPQPGMVGCTTEFDLVAGQAMDLELALRPEKPLQLTVIDALGVAQAAVWVQVRETGNTWSAGTTDAAGKVLLRGLGADELQFELYTRHRDGFAAVEILRFDAVESVLVVRP